jgi:hypothetical protein
VGRHISFGIIIAALIATAMAAIHGVMGEALFKLLGGTEAGVKLLVPALLLFMIAALVFWERERIGNWLQKKAHRHPLHWRPLLMALILFTITMLAQGVLAFSTAHLVADWTHHAYGWMVFGAAALFCGSTLYLWSIRDRLFVVHGKVEPVERTGEPLNAIIAYLSTPGRGSDQDYQNDKVPFEAAKQLFEDELANKDWFDAMEALCREGQKFGSAPFWNLQVPLRLLKSMANAPIVGDERLMVFVTTPESERRWEYVYPFFRKIAETQPTDQKIEVLHLRTLCGSSSVDDFQLKSGEFDRNLTLIQRGLTALRNKGLNPGSIAVDTTSAMVEHSVVGAIATINSSATFIYVNTNDNVVRRYDANAKGAWSAE